MRVMLLTAFLLSCLAIPSSAEEDLALPSLLAVSAGEAVWVIDPSTGNARRFDAGTVGWLYPAPGGLLFAPDVIAGKTSIIDLAEGLPLAAIDAVTTPLFGRISDRYLIVTRGEAMVLSYPDRTIIKHFDTVIGRPWVTRLTPDGRYAFVLERSEKESVITALDLWQGTVAGRQRIAGELVDLDFDLVTTLLVAAQLDSRRIALIDPGNLGSLQSAPLSGDPAAVAFARHGEQAVVAVGDAFGGLVERFKIKRNKKGIELKPLKSFSLDFVPLRLAVSPDQNKAAVLGRDGEVEIFNLKSDEHLRGFSVDGPARDMVWIDMAWVGPLLPQWSDELEQAETFEVLHLFDE